jgi:hypothetical protein
MRAAGLTIVKRTGSAALLIKRRNVPERQ